MEHYHRPLFQMNITPTMADVIVSSVAVTGIASTPCPTRQVYIDVFIMYIAGIGSITLIGLTLNVINILVLRHQPSSINSILLLQYLAVTDVMFLLVCFVYFPLRHLLTLIVYGDEIFKQNDWLHMSDLLAVIHPLFFITQNHRNWTVVLITMERFLSIAFPFWARGALTKPRLRLAFILLGGLSVGGPSIYWFRTGYYTYFNRCVNRVVQIVRYPKTTDVYFDYYYTVVTVTVPMMLIYVMNMILIYVMRKSLQTRVKLTHQTHDTKLQRQANAMVVSMMIVFTVCESLSCVDRVLTMVGTKFSTHSKIKNYLRKLGLLLNVVDSAFNFVAYCASNPSFRRGFLSLIRHETKTISSALKQTSVTNR